VIDQAEIHRMARSEDVEERKRAIEELKNNFAILEDKKQAWEDLHRLAMDNDHLVRELTIDTFGSISLHITDKHQLWQDLHHLIQDENKYVRWAVASALGSIFSRVPDKEQILLDLNLLTEDEEEGVCASANYAIGKAYIFRASEAKNEDDFRKYLEKAIEFFEGSSNQALNFKNQARFCHPFYRSFYMITFGKYDAEAEVKKYFDLSKNAIWGSKNKKTLLEAVENLGNALKEAQKARAYRRYLDHACELLETSEEKAPGASRLIRKGLPIIDERIKGIISEIQEKALLACQQSKGTPTEEIACAANREIQKWRVDDQEEMTWAVENLIFSLHSKIPNIPENKHIYDRIENIRTEENMIKQYNMTSNLIALIPSVIMQTVHTGDNITVSGTHNRVYKNSVDKSINIIGEKFTQLENQIEKDYKKEDKHELLQIVREMKQSCNEPSKQNWLKEKLGWILTRTSEVSSISSLVITLLQIYTGT
jgi:hypothetical protein